MPLPLLPPPADPIRGALHVNEAPTNYRYRLNSLSATNFTGVSSDTKSTLRKTWGLPYVAGITGIELRFAFEDNGAGTDTGDVTMVTPWAADLTHSIPGGWPALAYEAIIEIDDEQLTVDFVTCEWSYSFSELRLYLNGSGTPATTIGAQSESGSNFDLREDIVWGQALANPLKPVPVCENSTTPMTSCDTTYAAFPTHDKSTTNTVTFGWQWHDGTNWVSDDVDLLPFTVPGSCACVPNGDPPVIGVDESWEMVLEAFYTDVVTKTDRGNFTCTCPTSGSQTVKLWYRTTTVEKSDMALGGSPATSEIYDHRSLRVATCAPASASTSDVTTTELQTYCEYAQTASTHRIIKNCSQGISQFPCPEGEECTPAFPTYDDSVCCGELTVAITWPTAPVCGTSSTGISLTSRGDGTIYLGSVDADELVIGRAMPSAPTTFSPEVVTGLEVVRVAMVVGLGIQGPLWVARILGDGSADLRSTASLGASWINVISLPACDDVAICRASEGKLVVFTLESGVVRGQAFDLQQNPVGASWATNITGLSGDAELDAASYPRGEANYGIDLAVLDGGVAVVYSSTDGGLSFS